MPRREPRIRRYEVVFVGGDLGRPKLDQRKIDAIARVLGSNPSQEFLKAYSRLLSTYAAHAAAVKSATASAVSRRLHAVVEAAEALDRSLANLQSTDMAIFGRFAALRFLRGGSHTELNEIISNLEQFLPLVREALELVKREPKKGRMPAYAEQCLAQGIAQILCEEKNVVLDARRGGIFDRLLRLAFQHADPLRTRKDVVDLMKSGLSNAKASIASRVELLAPCRRKK